MLAFVGHELRAPLGIISGYTQSMLRWLQQRAGEVDLVHEARALQIVDVQTRRLGALLNDLLDTSWAQLRGLLLTGDRLWKW